jgi:hypothetical protein
MIHTLGHYRQGLRANELGYPNTRGLAPPLFLLYNVVTVLHKSIMTVTTNEYGQQNMFAKEPQMVIEDYHSKGLLTPMEGIERYNGRWAMMGFVSGLLSYAITGKLFFGIF